MLSELGKKRTGMRDQRRAVVDDLQQIFGASRFFWAGVGGHSRLAGWGTGWRWRNGAMKSREIQKEKRDKKL